ncbi:MAG: alpha/beta fold hydrolase [Thermohalobaculum sp.]|nr:alpha/beta fold hydrolase [Thermohalobaculum sp.]
MPILKIDEANGLYHLHTAPTRPGAPTFVFVNALTGSTDAWEAKVAPRLREAGFGTLSWNFRGQAESLRDPALALTDGLITDDLIHLVDRLAPARPILVGLSIGGLYAARAIGRGLKAEGLVFLNTLREIGPRIAWVNDALPALVGHGGVALFMDALLPLLVNAEFAATARANALKGAYAPMDPSHGHLNLMRHAPATDWGFDWPALRLPVLSITGLQDRVFLDIAVVDRLAAAIPGLEREDWADAGHLLPLERPERLAESLARFGARIEGRA